MSDPVPLTIAPNVPMADLLVAQLKDEGIPAYYQTLGAGAGLGGPGVNPSLQVEVYVNPEDLERAKRLLD